MRKPKQNSGWWAYLEREGKLDAPKEELAILRKTYRREYERNYKRDRKGSVVQYVTSFEQIDAKRIKRAAGDHGMKDAVFVKKAVIGYLNTSYVIRDKTVLDRVLQVLLRFESVIGQVESRDKGSWYKADRSYEKLGKAICEIRAEVTQAFANPPLITAVVSEALRHNPKLIDELKRIINDHDSKINVPKAG